MPLTLKDDDGYLNLTVESAAGSVTVALDLFEALNTYAALCDRFDVVDQAVELMAAWVEWLVGKGVPPLSHGAAMHLAAHVRDEVGRFKKKAGLDWESPESPSSSESPSTENPSAN